jgi:hypothetical protein
MSISALLCPNVSRTTPAGTSPIGFSSATPADKFNARLESTPP